LAAQRADCSVSPKADRKAAQTVETKDIRRAAQMVA
jgi:hypothetical protein